MRHLSKKTSLIGLVLILTIFVIIISLNKSLSLIGLELSKEDASSLKSQQQFAIEVSRSGSLNSTKHFSPKFRIVPASLKRAPSNFKKRGHNTLDRFLDKANEQYGWSSNLYAIPTNTAIPAGGIVIKKEHDLNWIQTEKKSETAYTVVKEKSSGRIGIYTGKIIVLRPSDEVVHYIQSKQSKYIKISSTLIVSLHDFESALKFSDELKETFPALKADIDINFSRESAK